MVKTIYVVTEGFYSDIVGVFDNEAQAQRCVDLYGEDARIEEYNLNALPDVPENMLVFVVSMHKNGDSLVWPQAPTRNPEAVFMFRDRYWTLNVTVHARDEQHAVKIANEKRAMLIAAGMWPEHTPEKLYEIKRIE